MAGKYSICTNIDKNELYKSIDWLHEYKKRLEIVSEVILDQELLYEDCCIDHNNKPWKYHFIIDFYQIFQLAFPPTIKIHYDPGLSNLPIVYEELDENELLDEFHKRARNSIPFLATIKTEPPILIPQYQRELKIRISMLLDRMVRLYLNHTLNTLKGRTEEILTQWQTSINNLKKLKNIIGEKEFLNESSIFSKLTAKGFYYISIANSVNLETLKYLFRDKSGKSHVRELDNKYLSLLIPKDSYAWIKIFNKYRPAKPLSNVLDAEAITLITKLNELSIQEKRKDLFFLISDTNLSWGLLRGSKQKILEKYNLSSKIKRDDFPTNVPGKELSILRTTYHFEEWLRAHPDKDDYKELHTNLLDRELYLKSKIKLVNQTVEDVLKSCRKLDKKCDSIHRNLCKNIIKDVNAIKESGENYHSLRKIIATKSTFSSLLEFINECLEKSNIAAFKQLERNFDEFFQNEEDQYKDAWNSLRKALKISKKIYQEDMNIIAARKIFEPKVSKRIFSNLVRMNGLLFNKVFSNQDENIKAVASILQNIRDTNFFPETISDREYIQWYYELTKIIYSTDNIRIVLLLLIIQYCFYEYDYVEKICSWIIMNQDDLIREEHLCVEFIYLKAAARARKYYNCKNKIDARKQLTNIIDTLKRIYPKIHDDERLGLLIGKIYLWGHFNKIFNISILNDAYNVSQKSLESLEEKMAFSQESINFDPLQIRLKNLIVYAVSKMSKLDSEKLGNADTYFKDLFKFKHLINIRETIASYQYSKARMLNKFSFDERYVLYSEAIMNLNYVIEHGKDSYLDKTDFQKLIRQKEKWEKEGQKLFPNKNL